MEGHTKWKLCAFYISAAKALWNFNDAKRFKPSSKTHTTRSG